MDERVQVQGLGDAVPGLQPTIQRAGQYSVGQRRAGRNKLMDLADALSQVNPILQQYTQVADIEAEQFEDELSKKSPEEIQAMLQKTEGEFDKLSRKGAMSWLTSPINRKRKLEAVGNLSSRNLISQITTRLENPEVGDEDADQIIAELRDEYINKNPLLRDSVLSQGGLQESLNRVTPSLKTNFDRKMSAENRREQALATTAGLYDFIDSLKDTNTLVTGGIADGAYTDDFKKIWEGSNAHNATEQRAILKGALGSLARNGMQDEAEELRIWAASNLKFGTAKMTEMEQDELDDFIDDVAEQAEDRNDRDQVNIAKELVAQIGIAIFDLKEKGTVAMFNGTPVNNENELIDLVGETYEDSNGVRLSSATQRELRKSVIYEVNNYKSPEKRAADASYNASRNEFSDFFKVVRNPIDGTKSAPITATIAEILRSEYFDIANVIENNPNILYDGVNDFNNQLQEEAQRLAAESEDFDPVKIKNKLTPFARKLYKTTQKNLREEYVKVAKVEKEKNDLLQTTKTEAGNEEVIEDSFWEKLRFGHKTEKEKVENYIAVLGNTEIDDIKEQEKAYKKLSNIDFTDLLDKAYKRKPVSVQRVSTTGFDPLYPKDVFMSEEDAEEVKMLYKKSSIYLGYYTDLETLRDGLLPEGERFNPRALDAKVFPILTYKEIKMGLSTTESIKEKAELIGRGDDVDSFLNEQKKLFERYKKSKRTYPRFERPVSARPQNGLNASEQADSLGKSVKGVGGSIAGAGGAIAADELIAFFQERNFNNVKNAVTDRVVNLETPDGSKKINLKGYLKEVDKLSNAELNRASKIVYIDTKLPVEAKRAALKAKINREIQSQVAKRLSRLGVKPGRIPTVRGMGGGLIDMFIEGPELQQAKSDPTYGMGEEERRNLEQAYQDGI
jgi:hypothetical protein